MFDRIRNLVRRRSGSNVLALFGLTILLPGVLLTVFGVRALVQERRFAQQQIRERLERAAQIAAPAESGGGPMFDFGCHRLEVLINLLGAVERVAGSTANVVFEREVEDTATASLHFESGAVATLAVTHAVMEPQDTLDVFGTAGSMHVATLNAGELRILTSGGDRVERHPPAANLHGPLVEDFVAAVTSGREPAVSGPIGRAIAALEDAIYNRNSSQPSAISHQRDSAQQLKAES